MGGIETVQDREKVGGAECEADSGDILLDEFLRVEAYDFAAGIEKRPAGIARVDGSVGLDPSARPVRGELTDSTDDALGDAEQHGVAGAANREHGISLADGGKIGEGKNGKDEVWRRGCDFDEGDVEVGVDVDDLGLKLHTALGSSARSEAPPPRAT